MASKSVLELSDATFSAEVEKSDTPVLVDFWAEWCGPCRMLAPTIEELAGEYAGKVKVAKLDTDSNRESAMRYRVNMLPTILLFKNGEVVKKFVGLTDKEDFKQVLDSI